MLQVLGGTDGIDPPWWAEPRWIDLLLKPMLLDEVRAVRTLAGSRLAGAPDELLEPYQRERLAEVIAEHVADMRYSLDFSFAGHNLGNLYSQLGEPEKAIEFYRAAIDVECLDKRFGGTTISRPVRRGARYSRMTSRSGSSGTGQILAYL